jgi:peptidyl-tRNA hydrolase
MRPAQNFQNMKQMIIVNAALKMPTDALAIQMARASAGAFIAANKSDRKIWLKAGRPQIVLKALGEEDLEDLLSKAERRKLPIYRVNNTKISTDQGIACIGIGPVCDLQVDQLKMVLDFYGWVRQNAMNARLFG